MIVTINEDYNPSNGPLLCPHCGDDLVLWSVGVCNPDDPQRMLFQVEAFGDIIPLAYATGYDPEDHKAATEIIDTNGYTIYADNDYYNTLPSAGRRATFSFLCPICDRWFELCFCVDHGRTKFRWVEYDITDCPASPGGDRCQSVGPTERLRRRRRQGVGRRTGGRNFTMEEVDAEDDAAVCALPEPPQVA